jgi:carbon storage regulator
MLVLSRDLHEHILIGETIRVTVLEISRRGQVKLGIEAPKDVVIVRSELLTRQPPPIGKTLTVASPDQCQSCP